ncbi:MAG TPA: ferrochelatase [Pyrinomonadaceae bacterium]|nr:ferrochelatase [Pyrinomonadaceae bacterium]
MSSGQSNNNYDALLLVSFGGPEGPDEVIPFLENVLRGKNVPRERLLQVAEHYKLFGGVSPINQQNRNLIQALQKELDTHGPRLPIYWGNRNWHPLLPDTLSEMARDGVRKALAFATSAYSSYSSCRQYLENIADARNVVGPGAPQIDKVRAFYNHPLFIEANVEQSRAALSTLPQGEVTIVFTAHSIPSAMATNCDYEKQLRETGRLVADALNISNWDLAFQSRSGPPTQPWLEPDISSHLRTLKTKGVENVVIAPIGFVSDHMEVIYDLDIEAKRTAAEIGLSIARAATAGTHPLFVKMVRELLMEKTENAPRRFLGDFGPNHDVCAVDCCLK